MKNVLVVTNPNAGRRKALKHRKILQKFLLQNAENFKFISLEELDYTDKEPFDTIVAMGGDGTVNKVVPCVINTEKVLGIIPCGTANLLAEKLNIPTDIKKAVNRLKEQNIKTIDAVKINDSVSVLRFGCGYDAEIICKTPQSLKNKFGYFAYFIAGILFALRLKNKEYNIVSNGEQKTVKASCIVVSNASNMYKKMFCLGKNTQLDDGLFDVFFLKTCNPIVFFFELIKISLNCYKNTNTVEFFQTDNFLIKTNWLNTHIDGDEYKFKNDVSFQCIKSAVKVVC